MEHHKYIDKTSDLKIVENGDHMDKHEIILDPRSTKHYKAKFFYYFSLYNQDLNKHPSRVNLFGPIDFIEIMKTPSIITFWVNRPDDYYKIDFRYIL